MDVKKVAKEIFEVIGADNILSNAICMTRLRVAVKNRIDINKLESVEGVLGVSESDRIDIIVGPRRAEAIGEEFSKLSNVPLQLERASELSDKEKKQWFSKNIFKKD